MEWLKKNYDRFVLGVAGLLLVAVLAALYFCIQDFGSTFDSARVQPVRNDKIVPLDKGPVEDAIRRSLEPAKWVVEESGGSLFVAKPHFIDPTTKKPRLVGDRGGMVHPPVPDKWLLAHGLKVLSPTVLDEDPDKDGFTNREEYLGGEAAPNSPAETLSSTDPMDAKSHPDFRTKLFFKRYVAQLFRFKFEAYNGDPSKDAQGLRFQVNPTNEKGQRLGKSQFLEMGKTVEGTVYTLEGFKHETRPNPKTGAKDDVSVLTLRSGDTDQTVDLTLGLVVESPDSYAVLTYGVPAAPVEFKVARSKEFVLDAVSARLLAVGETAAEGAEAYRVDEIQKDRVTISRPSGEKCVVKAKNAPDSPSAGAVPDK